MKHGRSPLIDENNAGHGAGAARVGHRAGRELREDPGNIQEVKARGGRVIAICSEGDTCARSRGVAIVIPQTNALLQPIISVIPTQLFSYHVADTADRRRSAPQPGQIRHRGVNETAHKRFRGAREGRERGS